MLATMGRSCYLLHYVAAHVRRMKHHSRLLMVCRLQVAPEWRVLPESHPYHQWLIVCRGRSFVRIAGREQEAGPGQCLFFAKGRTHEEWTDPDAPHESITISFAWNAPADRFPVRVDDAQGRMRVLARWLTEEWPRHEEDSAARKHLYFQALLSEWQRQTADRQDPLVARVRAHIRANIGKPLTLNELAQVAGLSRCHFSRVYRAKAGRPVSDDLRALRVEHAQGLLMSTDIPIKDVAPLSGISDQHYLTRLFRKHLNVTPGELRRTRLTAFSSKRRHEDLP